MLTLTYFKLMDLKIFRYLFPIDFQVRGNKWL